MLAVLHPGANSRAFVELIRLFTRHRELTIEMTRREILDQYVGQIFGALWVFAHPLFLLAIYIFIFHFVMGARIPESADLPRDYTSYILAGLIPWLGFQQSMIKACPALTAQANLVKQVVFPLEVLVARSAFAALIPQFVALAGLFVYGGIQYGLPPWTYLLLPVVLAMQCLAMLGIAFVVAAVSVFVRDTKDFVQLYAAAGIYLIPVVYLPAWVPGSLRPLLYLNPLSYLIWCYQDTLFFGRIDHPWAWLVAAAGSVVAFVLGYRVFRHIRPYFANVL